MLFPPAQTTVEFCQKSANAQQTQDQIVDKIMSLDSGERIMILAPVVRAQKGMHEKVFEDARKSGYVRVRVDGSLYDLSEEIPLEKILNLLKKY